MGKGGESDVSSKKNLKLSGLSDEALKKWASAYGVNVKSQNRDALLEALVRFCQTIRVFSYYVVPSCF